MPNSAGVRRFHQNGTFISTVHEIHSLGIPFSICSQSCVGTYGIGVRLNADCPTSIPDSPSRAPQIAAQAGRSKTTVVQRGMLTWSTPCRWFAALSSVHPILRRTDATRALSE